MARSKRYGVWAISQMIKEMKRLSLQSRIAFNIIVCTLVLTIVLCGIILIVFKVHTGKIESGAAITLTDVENLFTILLRVCGVGCFVVLMLLFGISRRIARNSIKPIREIIHTAEAITHNNLRARIPLPSHTDELYELSETINNLLDRIEYAVERERNFTSYASHEFRTPLSVLKGTMEVLIRKSRSEAEYKERIGICLKEVDKLNDMVEQLLILTRYEDNRQSLHCETLPVESLINDCVGPYCDAILKKRMECKISIQPEHISLCSDKYLFSTVLNNLISNAVKYANEGGLFEIKGYQEDAAYRIEVHNTGGGIPPEKLEHIFEKFYRSYTPGKTEIKGFGLGLAIVKRFCDLLDITIEITSVPDKTTVAQLTIPLKTENGT